MRRTMQSRGRGSLDGPLFFSTALPTKKVAEFKAGQTIISQGEECTDVHYIDEGIVKLVGFQPRPWSRSWHPRLGRFLWGKLHHRAKRVLDLGCCTGNE